MERICQNCGAQLEYDDEVCSQCGVDVEEAEARPQSAQNKTKRRIKRIIYFMLFGVFSVFFIVSAIYLGDYLLESVENKNENNELAALVDQIKNQQAALPTNPNGEVLVPPDETLPYDPNSPILPEYQAIYALNNDLVGWIRIEGTTINHPVLHRPEEKDYYLKKDFEGKYDRHGCIYLREQCDAIKPSDNVVIYGHYMQDGTMFHDLHGYYRKSYWQEHQFIQFDTIYERHTYQIIAVFKTSANIGQGFAYHQFNDAANEEEFNNFVDTVKSMSFYNTGVDAEYGDMLITLSTCEYTLDNGRLVVVAKRIS